jgi:hypothetical membrane protein
MTSGNAFSWPVRRYGLLGLAGAATFVSSLVVLHLMTPGIDWVRDYVSELANETLGSLFIVGTFVHGSGNLALTLGLRAALQPGRLRTLAVLLFGLAALGILLSSLFPIDPPGQAPSMAGYVHRTVSSAAFALELFALFAFSATFARQRQQAVSLLLSVIAAVAVALFVIAVQVGVAPGLAERAALAVFLSWELWAIFQLIRL